MAKTSLAAYTIRIKKRNTKEYLPIDSFSNSETLQTLIQKCLSNWKSYAHNEERKQLVSLTKSQTVDELYSGILEIGEWGYDAKLYDVKARKVTYTRKTTEAEMLPFYFLFGFPKGSTKAFLLLERFGAFGIRKVLSDFLQVEFQKKFPNFTLEVIPIVMEEVASQYLSSGRIVRLSFISYSIPSDLASYVAEGSGEEYGHTELVIQAKKRGELPFTNSLRTKLAKGENLKKIFEMPSFEYDAVKLKIEMDGNTRTIALEDLANIRSYFSIDDEVDKAENGHPVFESIEALAIGIYQDLKRRTSI